VIYLEISDVFDDATNTKYLILKMKNYILFITKYYYYSATSYSAKHL